MVTTLPTPDERAEMRRRWTSADPCELGPDVADGIVLLDALDEAEAELAYWKPRTSELGMRAARAETREAALRGALDYAKTLLWDAGALGAHDLLCQMVPSSSETGEET